MAKISLSRAQKYFALDPESPTGLRWRVDNDRPGSKSKAGDPVGFFERMKTGYIPLATVRGMLKESDRERSSELLRERNRKKDLERRSESTQDRIGRIIRDRFDVEGNVVVWKINYRGAVAGHAVKASLICIDLHIFSHDDIRSIIQGKEWLLPERVSAEEWERIRREVSFSVRSNIAKDNRENYPAARLAYLESRVARDQEEIRELRTRLGKPE